MFSLETSAFADPAEEAVTHLIPTPDGDWREWGWTGNLRESSYLFLAAEIQTRWEFYSLKQSSSCTSAKALGNRPSRILSCLLKHDTWSWCPDRWVVHGSEAQKELIASLVDVGKPNLWAKNKSVQCPCVFWWLRSSFHKWPCLVKGSWEDFNTRRIASSPWLQQPTATNLVT